MVQQMLCRTAAATHLWLLEVQVAELERQPDCVEAQELQRVHNGGKITALPAGSGLNIQTINHGLAIVKTKPGAKWWVRQVVRSCCWQDGQDHAPKSLLPLLLLKLAASPC